MAMHVLTLSTLFPDMTRPNFGVFVERQTRELARHPGVEVTVVAPVGMPPWPLDRLAHYRPLTSLARQESWRDLTVYRPRFTVLPGLNGAAHVHFLTRALLPLVRAIHERQPIDVIDASFFFPDGPVAANLSRALGIPFSVKARGSDIHYWGARPATAKAIRAAGQAADGLLAVSQAMKRSMVALGMDADRIRVHYTGVDLDAFNIMDRDQAREEAGLADARGPVLLCVGALIERKGQALVIEALKSLPDAHLIIAGQGPERTAYQKLAEKEGVSLRTGFVGAVPHSRLPALYNAADVMILPSASEGLANAWVESLACGTPVVITDVGGARELLTDPSAGRIVERDGGAILQAIRELLAETPDRQDVRQSAIPFTWAANSAALFDHLSGIVKAASERR